MGKREQNENIYEDIELFSLLSVSENRLYYFLPSMCQSSGVATAILSQQKKSQGYM
jgi:hypothetical protein